ncbi:MAG: type IV secretory system conjugative DNA transfer family protein, partial [Acutalibacteraceae bacterium]
MPKRINADNVNVKGSVRRRKIIAAAVILCVFFLIEMYLAYNYLAYKAIANNYSSEIEALALALFYLFRNFCLPLNFHTLTECFLCCMRVWYFNIGVLLILLLSVRRQDKYSGMENGSARWANKAELELVKSRSIMGEIPVAHGIGINPDNYNINNLNTVVVGAAGAGKSFGVMIPEIMSMFGSYIITDVKGDLYKWTAKLLSENGYKVRVFNLENLKFSNSFNPIVYCETDTDIDKLVNAFVLNSRREGASTGDSIWEDTLSMLLFALIRYVVDNPDEEKTFYRCLRLANSIEIVNGRIAPYCEWLKIMERLEAEEPDNSAVINWRNVCVAAPETLQSVVISLTSRLRLWANEDLRILTMTDEMDFDRLPEEKTAIFLIMPEGDSTFRSISSMFVSTAVERLKKIAKQKYNGRLPMLVSFELDEFANIGTLPNW